MRDLVRNVRVALRVLSGRGSVGLTVTTVLTIALTLGACTAMFTIVYGVLLKPLPYRNADRIMQVWQMSPRSGGPMQTSDPNYEEWKEQNQSFEALAQYSSAVTSVTGASEPVRTNVAVVSREFFQIMGARAYRGRLFDQELEGSPSGVVVSFGFWQRFLGGREKLDTTLSLFNFNLQVTGVLPPDFNFPAGAEVWAPREIFPRYPSRTAHNWRVVGKLKADVRVSRAAAEMHRIAEWQKATYGDDIWLQDVVVTPLQESLVGEVRTRLLILLAAVGFLLLVACLNLANLILARSSGRTREVAVRSAMGASRWQLGRQFVVEILLMVGAGGLLGLVLANWGVQFLLSFEPGNLPRIEEIGLYWPVVAVTAGLVLGISFLLGLFPLIHFRSGHLIDYLREGRNPATGAGSGKLRSALVVSQVALTLVLLVGTALLARSFLVLLEVDPGFRTEGAVVANISSSPPSDTASQRRLADFHTRVMENLGRLSGVTAVGGVSSMPLQGGYSDGMFVIDHSGATTEGWDPEVVDRLEAAGLTGYAQFRVASEGYFEAMDIALLQGRLPGPSDDAQAPHVAVISQSLAENWPDADPMGDRIQFGNMDGDLQLLTVIGVVEDVRDFGLDQRPARTIYLNYRQRPQRTAGFALVIRSEGDLSALKSEARTVIREMDPAVPVRFSTLQEIFISSVSDRRFNLLLLGLFTGAALLLASLGIFGVISFSVSQRIPEIGVRLALGADPGSVLRMFLRSAMRISLLGLVIGLGVALAVARVMESLLYGINTTDPLSYLLAVPVLLLAALMACYLPARRASRVDPLAALSNE